MMKKLIRFCSAALLLLLFQNASGQAANDTLRTYIFGHSLINHALQVNPTPSQETSVPHWFHFLAAEAGYGYAVSGQYGFLPGHATNLPPSAQWGFDHVPGAWDSDFELFSEADFDNILITPANFVQYQPPTYNYYQDTLTPISATSMVFDWVAQEEDSLDFYIYENWPDMAGFLANGFPPSASEWAAYNADLNGGFHDWFLEYHDSLIQAHPNNCVRMIPTGPVISSLLAQSPYNQIPIDTLYEDDAPHGRPTIYFLAALVTYMAMYEEPAPPSFQVPPIIDSRIANNYPAVVNFIWNELLDFKHLNGDSRVFCTSPLVALDPEAASPAPLLFPNPTNGILTIQGELAGFEIKVYDLAGRAQQLPRSDEHRIDMSGLPNGMYLVQLVNAERGLSHVQKILKR